MKATPTSREPAVLVSIDHVSAGYSKSDIVLNDISLTVSANETTVILGPNGSGKSTTLRALLGLVEVRSGSITLAGRDITTVPTHERSRLGVGLLPQGHSVFPQMTVEENLLLGGWNFARDRAKLRDAYERTLGEYPLLRDMRKQKAGLLSGGQQRLLEVARLMLPDPSLVVIDEPSVGLAPIFVDEVYDQIERLKETGKTILMVDQNVQAAVDLADYVYVLEFGRVASEGVVGDYSGAVGEIVKEWLRV
jgi:branched-chain amino acid transport system ATP-binding protein